MAEITRDVTRDLEEKIPYLVANRNTIPPWGLHLAYRAYITCIQRDTEGRGEEISEALRLLKQSLSIMDGRWKVAGTYLRLIEAREVMGLL
jgi:hypothetical protein